MIKTTVTAYRGNPNRYHLENLFERQITGDRVTVIVGILWIVISGIIAFLVPG